MSERRKQYPSPKFSSLEEEDQYWKTHSPLDEGYEGEVQRGKKTRSSFLSVRLTGEELTDLRNIAEAFGIGPSTYARQILKWVIGSQNIGTHDSSFVQLPFMFAQVPRDAVWATRAYEEIEKNAHEAYDKAKQGDLDALDTIMEVLLHITKDAMVSSAHSVPLPDPRRLYTERLQIHKAPQSKDVLMKEEP